MATRGNVGRPRNQPKWALRVLPNSDLSKVSLGGFGAGRRPTVREGDRALLYERLGRDVVFWGRATIGEVRSVEAGLNGRQAFVASLEPAERFPSDQLRLLSDYRYTLPRITAFDRPERHFRRRYVRLLPGDAEALSSGVIHRERTAVGLLFETLPEALRVPFVLGRWESYEDLARGLLQVLSDVTREPVRMLLEADAQWQELKEMCHLEDVMLVPVDVEGQPNERAPVSVPDLAGSVRQLAGGENILESVFASFENLITEAEPTPEPLQRAYPDSRLRVDALRLARLV